MLGLVASHLGELSSHEQTLRVQVPANIQEIIIIIIYIYIIQENADKEAWLALDINVHKKTVMPYHERYYQILTTIAIFFLKYANSKSPVVRAIVCSTGPWTLRHVKSITDLQIP